MSLVPTSPLTWVDDATGQLRVAVGAPPLNYLDDAGIWAPICPTWMFQSPSTYRIDAGNHRVVAHSQGRITSSWKGPAGRHSFEIQPTKLYKIRQSDHQLTALGNVGNPNLTANGRKLTGVNIFPDIDQRVIYDEDSLTLRFTFHQAARDAIADDGPWEGYWFGIATELDLTGSGLSWRNAAGSLTINGVGTWGNGYLELHKNGTGIVAIKGGGQLHANGGNGAIPILRWLVVISNKLYLIECFDPLLMAALPAGDVWHNATFGDTTPEATGQDIRDCIAGTNFTITENGTGISISAYIDTADEVEHAMKYAVYTGAIGGNLSLLANGQTNSGMIVDAPAWYPLTFPSAPSFISGTQYTLVAWCEDLPADLAQNLRYGKDRKSVV